MHQTEPTTGLECQTDLLSKRFGVSRPVLIPVNFVSARFTKSREVKQASTDLDQLKHDSLHIVQLFYNMLILSFVFYRFFNFRLPVGDHHECSTHLDHGISSIHFYCRSLEHRRHPWSGHRPSTSFFPQENPSLKLAQFPVQEKTGQTRVYSHKPGLPPNTIKLSLSY